MKRIGSLLLLPLVIIFLQSCGGEETSTKTTTSNEETAASDDVMEVEDDAADQAVCLWGTVGLRENPGRGKDAKYITGITFGEVVELTGEEETIYEGGKERNYLEKPLTDGKTDRA